MSQRIINMHERYYSIVRANANVNKDLEPIDPQGVVRTAEPNNPMVSAEFQKRQEIVSVDPLEVFNASLTPDEIRIRDENEIEPFVSKFLTHFVDDRLISVPLYKQIGQVIGVLDPQITITLSLGRFVTKVLINNVEVSGNPAILTERISGSKVFTITVFTNNPDVATDQYSLVVHELSN